METKDCHVTWTVSTPPQMVVPWLKSLPLPGICPKIQVSEEMEATKCPVLLTVPLNWENPGVPSDRECILLCKIFYFKGSKCIIAAV